MSNKTIFQKLNDIFTPDGVDINKTNSYNIGDEIIKADNKEDFETLKKQALQGQFLQDQWQKVDNEIYQQSIHYETTRIGAYSDFESMEYYPEISAALDIMMEESTTPNDKGEIINIYSDSDRIKSIIEDLLINRMDIHTTLPMWTRNLCKYGDNFLYLKIDDRKGITGVKQMPNFEMERREGDLLNSINRNTGHDNNDEIRFYWKGKDVEFKSWQIAHFRLLGDDRKLPYGSSILEKARRIHRQLLLSEDAMLVYRITRAPERRVFKVFVGNIDDQDVPAYVNQIANRFKRKPMIDPQTGQMDLKFNQNSIDQDYFIPVRNENAQNPIDTLQGASNLDQIADIQYLRSKLFAALRVPKTFLGFDETTGEGKNLALQDIRFSRTVNRIQQAMIMELNKIIIIHLYLLGFEDDLDNFTITLNNPSTQGEMLKIEHLQQKISLYTEAVRDAGNGFAPMSMTRAKREILGFSNDQIKQDILEQRIEKAAAAELEQTTKIIKKTGFFDQIDNIYGDPNASYEDTPEEGGEGGNTPEGNPKFIGGGGGSMEGGLEGEEEMPEEDLGEEGGEEFGGETEDFGGENTEESIKRYTNILTERKERLNNDLKQRREKYKNIYTRNNNTHLNQLLSNLDDEHDIVKEHNEKLDKTISELEDNNSKIVDNINKMVND